MQRSVLTWFACLEIFLFLLRFLSIVKIKPIYPTNSNNARRRWLKIVKCSSLCVCLWARKQWHKIFWLYDDDDILFHRRYNSLIRYFISTLAYHAAGNDQVIKRAWNIDGWKFLPWWLFRCCVFVFVHIFPLHGNHRILTVQFKGEGGGGRDEMVSKQILFVSKEKIREMSPQLDPSRHTSHVQNDDKFVPVTSTLPSPSISVVCVCVCAFPVEWKRISRRKNLAAIVKLGMEWERPRFNTRSLARSLAFMWLRYSFLHSNVHYNSTHTRGGPVWTCHRCRGNAVYLVCIRCSLLFAEGL